MKYAHTAAGVSLLVLSLLGSVAQAQGRADFGKREFESSCASCHGASARGDGALNAYLVRPPSNLTTLAKRNGGVFPSQRVWDTIDGRTTVDIGPHGSREMPIWGNVYRTDNPQDAGWMARNRIASLLDYLARIQEP
jgi:mono/diheme cytochrome c family protein